MEWDNLRFYEVGRGDALWYMESRGAVRLGEEKLGVLMWGEGMWGGWVEVMSEDVNEVRGDVGDWLFIPQILNITS